eukprot:scaffold5150_cov133-Skeletonema_menzelii.AAC.14
MPAIKAAFASNDNPAVQPAISFDWKSLLSDRRMYSFATHFLLQKKSITMGASERGHSSLTAI